MSKQLNRKLPARVDFTTMLDRTTVSDTTITYRFRADISLKEVKPAEMKAWKSEVGAQLCSDPAMREILSLGGTYRYVFRDHYGRTIDTYVFRDCPAGT